MSINDFKETCGINEGEILLGMHYTEDCWNRGVATNMGINKDVF